MASNKNAKAVCDISGFVYPHRVMILNSYGLLVGPPDFDGAYDLKNHPQNKVPDVRDDINIRNPRPPSNLDRGIDWQSANTTWEDTDRFWNLI